MSARDVVFSLAARRCTTRSATHRRSTPMFATVSYVLAISPREINRVTADSGSVHSEPLDRASRSVTRAWRRPFGQLLKSHVVDFSRRRRSMRSTTPSMRRPIAIASGLNLSAT
jgi:hypothetical protein